MFKLRDVSICGLCFGQERSDGFFSSATCYRRPRTTEQPQCTPPGAFFATGGLMRETHGGNGADLGNIYSYDLGEGGGIFIMPLAMARAVALRRRVGNFGKC